MTDLANLDQALKLILEEEEITPDSCRRFYTRYDEILDAMRRAYALAESKEELAKRLGG